MTRLDVFLLQHLAPVRVVPRHGHRVLLEHRVGQRELRRVDVAERTHLGVLRVDGPELRAPLSADADEPQAHAPARHRTPERRRRAERRHGRGSSQHLEEVAASLLHLFGREIHTAGLLHARRRRLRAHPRPIEPRDASRTEGEQHPDRARLDQVLVDQEIRPLRPEFRASRWNRREIEHRKQRERAGASDLREQTEDEADPDCRQREGDTEIERADPRRVSQPVEQRRERTVAAFR